MKIITITLIAILFFSFIKCQNNCISITNCNDLLALNGSSCYQLANNIDCSSVQPFTPIFNFSGILYGNRLKIMNLNVFSDNAALFSFLPGGAAIYDLSIENSYFNGLYAAAFVSQTVSTTSSNASATMLNCYSKNNTIVSNSTASMASGLVAYVGYPLIMGGCWSTYNRIYSYTFSPSGNWSLSCYSGGLVAYVNSTFTLFECTSEYNDIRSLSSSSGSSSDASFAGGVVAFNGLTSTVITECISTNNYIFSFSKQSFLSNQIISCSGGICAECYGTIINSVSSLNRVKSSLDPSSLSTFMSTSGGISAFGNANSTNIVNTISRMNLLRSDSLNGTCDCFYLPGTGCSNLCSTTPNVLFV